MPELLHLRTADFEMTVWAQDIAPRQEAYKATLRKQQADPAPCHELRFTNALEDLSINGQEQALGAEARHWPLPEALFFENTLYQVEWVFTQAPQEAELRHRSQVVNSGFRFVPARGLMPARLTGTVQTGNDVGWLRLPLRYRVQGNRWQEFALAFEVLPTKMLLHRDVPQMYRSIDSSFPLWRFNLLAKTEQDAGNSRQRGNFPLLWLAQFGRLREQFELGLRVIAQAPHSRLQTQVQHSRADRLKGRVSQKLAQQVREGLSQGRHERRYRVENKRLSVDTPENRFIKMVVAQSRQQLAEIEQKLSKLQAAPDCQRLSEAFLQELRDWQKPMQKMLQHSFLQEVGTYAGMSHASLVLQQKTGYSTVYRAWQELRLYLDAFAGATQVSLKSVAEIYEIWCFLRLRQMLLEDFGFEEVRSNKGHLRLSELLEYELQDGMAGAFAFKRPDGVGARLVHEPSFSRRGQPIRSYAVPQKPDIVLEVSLPAGAGGSPEERRFVWLFDAKYRIKTERSAWDEDDPASVDLPPDDAINQMHRYRDALIYLHRDQTGSDIEVQKSRPVFAAFALYPGYFAAGAKNPYAESIEQVGIGAFPLLPDEGTANDSAQWLLDFLRSQIGGGTGGSNPYALPVAEHLYVQDAVRIPVYGMQQGFYPDLCMTAALGAQRGRSPEYFARFEKGTARWYHMPVTTLAGKFSQHVVQELRYLALARTASEQDSHTKQIDWVWPVLNVQTLPRQQIDEEQAGASSESTDLYYLFELGRPLGLQQPVQKVPQRPMRHSMRLTTLRALQQSSLFAHVPAVYASVLQGAVG